MSYIVATIFRQTRGQVPLPILGRVIYDLAHHPFREVTTGYVIVAWRVPELELLRDSASAGLEG